VWQNVTVGGGGVWQLLRPHLDVNFFVVRDFILINSYAFGICARKMSVKLTSVLVSMVWHSSIFRPLHSLATFVSSCPISCSMTATHKSVWIKITFILNDSGLVSISTTFYVRIFCANIILAAFFYVNVTRGKLLKQCSYEKFARKMLMKLTPGTCYCQNDKSVPKLIVHANKTFNFLINENWQISDFLCVCK